MSTAKREKSALNPQEEVVRLLAILIRRDADSQREAIVELDRAGFGPSRIAELLGTTAGTVAQDLKRAKKKPKPVAEVVGDGDAP